MSKYSIYDQLLEQAKAAGTEAARTWIPKLCQALKEEDKNLSNEDIKDRVEKDCALIWSRSTIRNNIPDEYKDPQKQEAGRQGREKQLEQLIPAGSAHEMGAENSFDSSTRQKSESFESMKRPNVFGKDMYQRMQNDFNKRLEAEQKQSEEIIKKKDEEIAFLRQSQKIDDIPQLVDNKIGPVKIQNLSKINDFDRRGYQILASRLSELLRRKRASEGKAAVKLYVITKNRTTNIEYLVPISFIVDMRDKSTEIVLDESRL